MSAGDRSTARSVYRIVISRQGHEQDDKVSFGSYLVRVLRCWSHILFGPVPRAGMDAAQPIGGIFFYDHVRGNGEHQRRENPIESRLACRKPRGQQHPCAAADDTTENELGGERPIHPTSQRIFESRC